MHAAHRFALALLLLGAMASVTAANVPDSGAFTVYQGGEAVGVETFSYSVESDSLRIRANTRLVMPASPADTIVKSAELVVKRMDYDLLAYRSIESFAGSELIRGLVLADTSLTVFTQADLVGDGVSIVRPPGRIFVIDPFLFTMFDVIGRNLHGRSFERRSIQVMVLTGGNSILEATATALGEERIRWGGKPVTARKLEIADGPLKFMLWLSPVGRMLRLEEQASGLRVEREPPPVKRRAPPGG